MVKSIRRIAWCVAVSAVLGILMPAAAVGAGHGSRGSGSSGSSHSFQARAVAAQTARVRQERLQVAVNHRFDVATHHRGQGGPLSYNAYWKAATSPNPPRTNQDYNRYWQKMQAWQQYHQR
jgi:hypothetical protein